MLPIRQNSDWESTPGSGHERAIEPLEEEIISLREALSAWRRRVEQLEARCRPGSRCRGTRADGSRGTGAEFTSRRVCRSVGGRRGISRTGRSRRTGGRKHRCGLDRCHRAGVGRWLPAAGADRVRHPVAGVGTSVGLLYAFCWAVASPVLAGRGRRRAATAAGLASVMVTLPLVWEACVFYKSLDRRPRPVCCSPAA